MNEDLARWIADADALRHIQQFRVPQLTIDLAHIHRRADDYYLSLAGELFTRMHYGSEDADGWARLGNALALVAAPGQEAELKRVGISQSEATLFAAAAFYCGGFPASAYLTIRARPIESSGSESYLACTDLLARPVAMRSRLGQALVDAVERGDMNQLSVMEALTAEQSSDALDRSPTEWIPARLLEKLIDRFISTNVRAVLPFGSNPLWTPFVKSLLHRHTPIWEFFPSQIDAIKRGLIESEETFSLQMPTSAGKTALSEAILYWHAHMRPAEVAILLVPYRSLASELRGSLVRHLNELGIPSKCIYGGTVPTGEEVHDLANTRVVVATPEALSGLLSVGDLVPRVSLVICDEGHLLDGEKRGVGLEMLLTRLKARAGRPPRFVFISAIVPNVDEINQWLGGMGEGVVTSNYRPAFAEYSVLRPRGSGADLVVGLDMHPHLDAATRYSISRFLSRDDFRFRNLSTGRINTYPFESFKVQAIASGRKALEMGTVAVFSANKRGDQGAIGLAKELVKQLGNSLAMPAPLTYADQAKLDPVVAYMRDEYGPAWIGAQTAAAGAVLHHGDIPQECREILESLLRQEAVRFVICTSTLAERINLPIRTLVLYSVQRRIGRDLVNLLTRDIKNLVGRAGRAGSTTKGLVICANEGQWPLIENVALQAPGEPVYGALLLLINRLRALLAISGQPLSNPDLEATPELYELVDGIDLTLIDLAAEEVGDAALIGTAVQFAEETFAAQRADEPTKRVLRRVFELRARRITDLRSTGRLEWIRATGSRPRLIDSVETDLLARHSNWEAVVDPLDANVVAAFLEWAWTRPEFQVDVRDAYRIVDEDSSEIVKRPLFAIVRAWLNGYRFSGIAAATTTDIDQLLGIHTSVVAYSLQKLVEHGVALLEKLLEERGAVISRAVVAFPEHLRFGVPTASARTLSQIGLRHRWAAVEIGRALTRDSVNADDRNATRTGAREGLLAWPNEWRAVLGSIVYDNTIADLRT
jgi:helicase